MQSLSSKRGRHIIIWLAVADLFASLGKWLLKVELFTLCAILYTFNLHRYKEYKNIARVTQPSHASVGISSTNMFFITVYIISLLHTHVM